MKTKLTLSCLSLVLAVAAGLAACDKASPVAPEGTVLSVTANPTQIGANGTAQIRVVALRANGTPVNPGTQIRMSTNLGTVDPIVEVGEGGIAVGTLQGDGRFGLATVTASVGADTTGTVDVQVGRAAASATLQATPPSISDTGGTTTLLALVRDASQQPLAGATVNFTTEVGRLASGGSFLVTDANGQVTDRLTVSESDINSLPAGTNEFTAGVEVGGTDAVVGATFEVRLESALLEADFTFAVDGLTVRFTDFSRGEPSQHLWSFGDGTTSREPNPTHVYSSTGSYPVTLQVTRGRSSSQATKQVPVSAP
jgi:hypothetical protein